MTQPTVLCLFVGRNDKSVIDLGAWFVALMEYHIPIDRYRFANPQRGAGVSVLGQHT
ncbi:MAG: hypothetical protein ACFCD0_21105 [Gemmataceae bacterium]